MEFQLVGTTERISVGRRAESDVAIAVSSVSYDHCELFLKRRNRDPVLCVRDLSKNGTGVRHPKASRGDEPFLEVCRNEVEVLQHKSELLVPARQKNCGSEDTRTSIQVLFSLPDAYDPQRNTGRWDYEEKLGEGGLAVVYRARDMAREGCVVAVKVSKFGGRELASADNRHIYALHREARWSIERLHSSADRRYERGGAALFARYLEDHTGFEHQHPKADFDGLRRRFEDPAFVWAKHEFDPPLAEQPYVVLEFVDGKLLQHIVDKGPPLDGAERAAVVRQCCKALVYMERFGVLHRDFRGCNIFLKGRGVGCRVQVIDLGFMITADPQHERNPNPAVRCAWQGDPERKVRFDWAPPEVRASRAPNFGLPAYSFDVYSFGVLVLKLLQGRSFAQDALHGEDLWQKLRAISKEVEEVGMSVDLLANILDRSVPAQRPLASQILYHLNQTRRSAGAGTSGVASSVAGVLPQRRPRSSPLESAAVTPPEPSGLAAAAADATAAAAVGAAAVRGGGGASSVPGELPGSSGPAAKRPRLATAGGADVGAAALPLTSKAAPPARR